MKQRRAARDGPFQEAEQAGLIVANLDCEAAWLSPSGAPGRTLGRTALRRASILASGLQVFSRSKRDVIWTPAPIEADIWKPLPNADSPVQMDGAISGEFARILPWGETRDVARLRARHERRPIASSSSENARRDAEANSPAWVERVTAGAAFPDWIRALWEADPCDSSVAARANDRGFALDLGQGQGLSLPNESMIDSLSGFEAWIESGGADASASGRWIVRQPFSAAGRGRLIGDAKKDRTTLRPKLEAMLAQQGRLHCAPLMDRIDDWGLVGFISDLGTMGIGWHRQDIRGFTAFAGLTLRPGQRRPHRDPGLDDDVGWSVLDTASQARLSSAFDLAGRALFELGYRGPFGIDAWRYRDANGQTRLHALGEINARLTMGHVAWAFLDRFGDGLGWTDAQEVRMNIARLDPSLPARDESRRWTLAAWQDRGQDWSMWMEANASRAWPDSRVIRLTRSQTRTGGRPRS